MDTFFQGKTILITGSGRGIGAATARLAKSYGANVILHDRSIQFSKKLIRNYKINLNKQIK